jgi:hypothetical protein
VEPQLRSNWGQSGLNRNRLYLEEDTTALYRVGLPNDYYPPYSYSLPQIAGNIRSEGAVTGIGYVVSANLAGGLNAEATITADGLIVAAAATLLIYGSATLLGIGDLTADITGSVDAEATIGGTSTTSGDLGALVSLLASLAGTGAVDATLQAILPASATLGGLSDLVADITGKLEAASTINGTSTVTADVVGIWNMVATLVGTSDLQSTVTAFGRMVAQLNGAGAVSATPYASGDMSATITAAGEVLTATSLANAVWNALITDFNALNTMGAQLNIAGGGSSPTQIADEVRANLTAELAAIIETWRIHGLDPTKPLIVTPTSRDAGAGLHQDIVKSGVVTTVTKT